MDLRENYRTMMKPCALLLVTVLFAPQLLCYRRSHSSAMKVVTERRNGSDVEVLVSERVGLHHVIVHAS
jgi:hypothetical protein